jgi:hypothetical protein
MRRKVGAYTRYKNRWLVHNGTGLVIYEFDPAPGGVPRALKPKRVLMPSHISVMGFHM